MIMRIVVHTLWHNDGMNKQAVISFEGRKLYIEFGKDPDVFDAHVIRLFPYEMMIAGIKPPISMKCSFLDVLHLDTATMDKDKTRELLEKIFSTLTRPDLDSVVEKMKETQEKGVRYARKKVEPKDN